MEIVISEEDVRLLLKGEICEVARNTKSTELIKILSKEENLYVRICVAINENTPEEIKKELANDEQKLVRQAVAQE